MPASDLVKEEPNEKNGDEALAKFVHESVSIRESEPNDADAKLTVRVVIPGIGDSDEVFYLKKVVTRITFERNADGVYSGTSSGSAGNVVHCFRACGAGGGVGGSSSVSSSSPDRVNVSIHRSWTIAGAKGEAGGEIEVPWLGQSQKEFKDGTTFRANFVVVENPKQ